MKSKKKMLLALGAMSAAAIGAGATSTFAWYTANNNAKISATNVAGAISSASTTIGTANNYYIKVTVALADPLQLSHLGAGDKINASGDATYVSGTLYKGVYESGSSLARVEALANNEISDFAKAYTITARWCDSSGNVDDVGEDGNIPTDAFDVAYLGGKHFSVTITPSGTAKLKKDGAKAVGLVSGTDYADTATVQIDIADDTLAMSVTSNTMPYVRLEPKNLEAAESAGDHGTGKDALTPTVAVDGSSKVILS